MISQRRSPERSASVFETIANIAVVAPCRTAVPEAADEPQRQRRLAEVAEVVDVLDEREPGADGEALHGGVDEEPDAPLQQEHDEEAAFSASSVTGAT